MTAARLPLLLTALLAQVACSGSSNETRANGDPSTADDAGSDDDSAPDEDDGDQEGACESASDQDADRDGFTPSQGDCDDCDARVNPGAYDFPDNDEDEDCSGAAASENDAACDEGLAMGSLDARDAARALGLCKFTDESSKAWGVIEARFTKVKGDGELNDPLQVGLLPDFGVVTPQAGASMLALSSGVARAADQPDYTPTCDLLCHGTHEECMAGEEPPPGYPKDSSQCATLAVQDVNIFDQAALELKIRVPNNARSFAFDSAFFSYEYPDYICTYNDFYVVFQSPKPAALVDENIMFDAQGDPIGVNTGLLAVCDPTTQNPLIPRQLECEKGSAFLEGTGFDLDNTCLINKAGASTGWLHTRSPVEPGSIVTLRFAIWDTRDLSVDSTVLIDAFIWSEDSPDTVTEPIL